jgi:hypothetical protein
MAGGMANLPNYGDMQHSNDAAEAQASFNDVFSLRWTSQPIVEPQNSMMMER